MACFTQKSLNILVDTLAAACHKSLEQSENLKVLTSSSQSYNKSNFGTLLTSKIAADIGSKWLNQMKTNAELERCIRLLCYYQIPYPKATTFNILCSGLLLCCDLVAQKLKSSKLSKLLAQGKADQQFAFDLAVNLQRMLPLNELKSNAMCIRPKFYKPEETHGSSSLEFKFQNMYSKYMYLLRKSFLTMGYLPTINPNELPIPPRPTDRDDGEMWDLLYEFYESPNEKATEEAKTVFNYSVEGGMNEHEAQAMLDAILVAEDILNVGENWFNFSALDKKCRNKKLINSDTEVQKTIAVMISEMFDQQTLDKKHLVKGTGRERDFFDKVFGKTILENVHRDFTQGDPVQLRLFSRSDSGDQSNINAASTIAGSSKIRECHLLPLSQGSKYKETSKIKLVDTDEDGRPSLDGSTVYKSRQQRKQDNFFSQMSAGSSYLSRMVVRMRVDTLIDKINQDPTWGRSVYVANRFEVALTLIHELMHTYYAMVDFYYRDESTTLPFKAPTATAPLSYCGLSLGEQSNELDSQIQDKIYPYGETFDIKKYHWQINNVDNYMILLTKLYIMDDNLVKLRFEAGDKLAYEDKKAIATMRLCWLTSNRDDKSSDKTNMPYLTKLEEFCWTRKDKTYQSIIEMARKTNKVSKLIG